MSETQQSPLFRTAEWRPGGRLIGNQLSDDDKPAFAALRAGLEATGEEIDEGWLRRQFADPVMLAGLAEAEQRTGTPAHEFVTESHRFRQLTLLNPGLITNGHAEIPAGPDNIHQDGRPRRHESGAVVDLDRVRAAGIDPSRVLYYRVTQPGYEPKPEYYWTSDSVEVRGGLSAELGSQASTAIVVGSTLEAIAQNSGLIRDMNDDQGFAVRQIGLGPSDQSQVLFSFPRTKTV